MQRGYVWLLQSCDLVQAMFYGVHLPPLLMWSNQSTHLPFQSFKSLVASSFTLLCYSSFVPGKFG